jgi:hypothetical protein
VALLNPPELRPSVLLLIVGYLAQRRGQRDDVDRLIATIAPSSLSEDAKHQLDVRVNLTAAIELALVTRSGEQVALSDRVAERIRRGSDSFVSLLRQQVLDERVNSAPWGSQVGSRDLTNALAWFLTFSANEAPTQMEGGARSAKELQEIDFGPRQPPTRRGDPDDDSGGWPISNLTRWTSFRRWACSLGFAWVTPRGWLTPDPTTAIRESVLATFAGSDELPARDFVARLGATVPVLEFGRYREFVESNWRRSPPDQRRLSDPTSDALERLRSEGRLVFDDRADAPRITRADGSTFSHVRKGPKP